jgi:ATP-dependent Clp protease ATP-binding subunit ClpC
VENLFTSNHQINPSPSQVWIEQIEQLIKEYKFIPIADDKKISNFLNILICIRNRVSDKAPWNQKIQNTARKFSSALKLPGKITQAQKSSSTKKQQRHNSGLNPQPSTLAITTNFDSEFSVLSVYCKDLTSEKKLSPFIGRDKEILQIAEILGREQKSTPLLLGAPGVGKIAIIQGIAEQIIKKSPRLPSIFQGKKIFLLKDTEIFAHAVKNTVGAAYILVKILQEAEQNKGKLLLIFENLEGFLGGDERDQIQMRHLLLSALGNKSINCIATTTPADYSRMVQKDQALEYQFSPVKINQPSDKELTEILSVAIPWLAVRHAVSFDDKIGSECVKLARKYLKNASFPAIIIDILDQTASQYKIEHPPTKEDGELSLELQSQSHDPKKAAQFSQTIHADLLYPIFSEKTGLPLGIMNQSNKELLQNLDKRISERIKGQSEAIKSLCDGVRISRFEAGNGRSMAVFLFLGTTGVGKTETVRILAELLYGSPDKMLRLDMAEYSTEIDKTKLIGVAPGYVGNDKGGQLTNWLKYNPFSIVLFDEIEKAHKQIRQLLLGLFDAGRITDGQQNTLECPDVICIMTSNLGADEIPKHPNDTIALKKAIDPILRGEFSPEFLGRVRTTAIFRSLDKENVRQITELRLKEIKEACKTDPRYLGIDVEWTPEVVSFFADNHYDSKKGGRGIETAVKDNIKTILINGVISEKIQKGNKVVFSVNNDKIDMRVIEHAYY